MIYYWTLIISLAGTPIQALPQINEEQCLASGALYMARYVRVADEVTWNCVPMVYDRWLRREGVR